MASRLILVGANKGGVGKTTVARLLLDYAGAAAGQWRVFDGQAPGGSLRRFWPAAELVAFGTTAGRMRVLDGVGAAVTLVDLPAGLLSETLQMMSDVGFLGDVAQRRASLTVVHVLGPSVDSMGEAADVAARLAEGGEHVLVRNAANDDQFQYDARAYDRMLDLVSPAAQVDVRHLDGTAREMVDVAGATFSGFARDLSRSDYVRRLVSKWQADTFAALGAAKVDALIR